jgi:hypothetical protein
MRKHATEVLGARRPEVREWEIAAMHRLHPAGDTACARVTWTRGDPESTDRVVDTFRMGIAPRMDDVPGFCSLSLMVHRTSGMGVLTSLYRDRAALDESRSTVMGLREDFSRQMDLEIIEMAELDLVIHHLRVPELV